jgi:hypothetical protein
MSGESRLSYHGVPKILKSHFEPWNRHNNLEHQSDLTDFKDERNSLSKESKRPKLYKESNSDTQGDCGQECSLIESYSSLKQVGSTILTDGAWSEFLDNYASKSRINLNIRQVLYSGQTTLNDVIT